MEPLFEGLSSSEIEYLEYLQKQGYFDGIEMFMNLDTSSDYRVEKLENGGYITLSDDGPYPGSCKVTVTGKGIAALIDYDKYQNQIQPINEEINALNAIAGALRNQVTIAEESAEKAKRDSIFSKKMAVLSLIVAVVSLLPMLIHLTCFALRNLL